MRFKVGDIVRIGKKSKWNDGKPHNPMGINGKITRINNASLRVINVDWDNGKNAGYDENDLKLVKRA